MRRANTNAVAADIEPLRLTPSLPICVQYKGNMELLAMFGTDKQKKRWLQPLLDGEIRSCFAMTEPEVASSDATNISTTIERRGSTYVINGRKWWTTGALDSRCKLIVVLGRGPVEGSAHQRHSIVLVPMDTDGISIVRALTVFGYDDAPNGHGEVLLSNVTVPADEALLHKEGRGFEAAQARLGGGRLHHCMRAVGTVERALGMMISRAGQRTAFGKRLVDNDAVRQSIGESRCDVESMRAIVIAAAAAVDSEDIKKARQLVAVAKVMVPRLGMRVLDSAVQIHGGMGVCQDTVLAMMLSFMRALRLADGPDEVHLHNLGKADVGVWRKRAKM